MAKAKRVPNRKVKKTTGNKNPVSERLKKAAQPPYSTYDPDGGVGVQPPK